MPSGHPPGIPQLSSATLLNASMRRNTSLCQSPRQKRVAAVQSDHGPLLPSRARRSRLTGHIPVRPPGKSRLYFPEACVNFPSTLPSPTAPPGLSAAKSAAPGLVRGSTHAPRLQCLWLV
jgi:hypothetical protein